MKMWIDYIMLFLKKYNIYHRSHIKKEKPITNQVKWSDTEEHLFASQKHDLGESTRKLQNTNVTTVKLAGEGHKRYQHPKGLRRSHWWKPTLYLRPKDIDESGKAESANLVEGLQHNKWQRSKGTWREKAQSCLIEKASGEELKQTRITAKVSKQRPHQFTQAMNISKSAAWANRSTVTLIKIKT